MLNFMVYELYYWEVIATELLCYYHLYMIAGTGNFGGKEIKGCSGRAVYQVVTEAV